MTLLLLSSSFCLYLISLSLRPAPTRSWSRPGRTGPPGNQCGVFSSLQLPSARRLSCCASSSRSLFRGRRTYKGLALGSLFDSNQMLSIHDEMSKAVEEGHHRL